MTPSIEERREAAERLRYVGRSGGPEWGTAACCIAECVGEDDYPLWGGSTPLFEKLADLIEPLPERTCRIDMPVIDWETGETDFRCSSCGFSADPQEWVEIYAYCPNCGAKVVEE